MKFHRTDCRHFRGAEPCRLRDGCDGCDQYTPIEVRILVIKLAAAGDVLRTTPILPALRRAHPGAHITWVTRKESIEMLEALEEIDRLLALDAESAATLEAEPFDRVICLDKEPAATGLAARIQSPERQGFTLGPDDELCPANPAAEFAHRLGLDDTLKFRTNQRSYQDITFEMLGLAWNRESYRLEVPAPAQARAEELWRDLGVAPGDSVVGLNVGAGDAFAYKDWRVEGWAELAELLEQRPNVRVALLGGPRDRERVAAVARATNASILAPDASASILEFAALLDRCSVIVTGDTLGMHLGIARQRPVVVLFGSTCPQEIELYGRGEKIIPKIDCHPCYKHSCDFEPSCADEISAQVVFAAVSRVLAASP